MPDPRRRDELSETLLQLRRDADMSTTQVGTTSGLSQSSVSRYERGKTVPGVDDLAKVLDALDAPAVARRHLLQLVGDLREDVTPSARVVMTRGAGEMQARIGRIERASARIATFQPAAVPGLMQTEAYMRAVFASGGDMPADQQEKAVTGRLARQAAMGDPPHEFLFLLTEGVLRWHIGSPAVMAAQLDHVVEVSRRPGVQVGVIAWTTAVDLAPMHGFDLYDERAAIVGTETATAFLTNPRDVEAYVKLLADLQRVATLGDGARGVLAEAAADYRSLI